MHPSTLPNLSDQTDTFDGVDVTGKVHGKGASPAWRRSFERKKNIHVTLECPQ